MYYKGQLFYYFHKKTHKKISVVFLGKDDKGYLYFKHWNNKKFRCYKSLVNKEIFPMEDEPFKRNTSAWVNPTADEPKHINKTPVSVAIPVKEYRRTVGTLKNEKNYRSIDRQKRLNKYWDNLNKPGIQKDID